MQRTTASGTIVNKGIIKVCLPKECTSRSPGKIFAEIRLTEPATETGGTEDIIGVKCIWVAQILESSIYKNGCDDGCYPGYVPGGGSSSSGGGSSSGFNGAFSSLTGIPTTIAGYGITDAFDGEFSSLTGKPTTLAGYGITDALKAGGDFEGNLSGSVFADDSTLLVDGVSGSIPSANLTGTLPALDGSSLTGVLKNVVEDTTPELGGDLVIGNNKLKYTATGDGGSQLVLAKTIYSVPNTTVFSSVGSIDLFIDSLSADTAQTAFRIFNNTDPDGTVTETNNIFKVDGNTGDVSVTGKVLLPDGSVSANYAGFGDDDDLKIFHNGNHSIIRETGTGDLYLQSDNNVILGSDSATETYVKGIYNGAVELYHDDVKKLETTADGVTVTGKITGLTDPTDAQDAATKAYVDANLDTLVTTNTQSSSYILVLSDRDQIVEMSSASNTTLTVPPNSSVAFPVGSQVMVARGDTGTVEILAGTGVTINSSNGNRFLQYQYSGATLVKKATNEWWLFGDLSAS